MSGCQADRVRLRGVSKYYFAFFFKHLALSAAAVGRQSGEEG